MSLTAIILVVVSAFLHAGWNLVTKHSRPSAAFFLVATFAGALLLAPFLVLCSNTLAHGIPIRVWILLFATGFFLALYYVGLAAAYRAADMSVAYPLARSSPVIVVTVVSLVLGKGEQISAQCIVGIFLVAGGCFLIPLQHFRDLRPGNYWNATCGFALLAAIGTSGYSILDDEALRILRGGSASSVAGATQVTIVYLCLEALAASLWLLPLVALRREGRSALRHVLSRQKRRAASAGVAIYAAYLMVLVALAFAKNVSYVVGFRQLSIPLGAAFGILILKEAPHRPKLAGVAIMFVGLLLVAAG